MHLIVGLGNPGKKYEGTRHNIGFAVLEKLAGKYQLEFRKKQAFEGSLAEGKIGQTPVILLMPLTYMNESGRSVKLIADYRQIDLSRLMIVADDVALPVGQIRMRINSSPGGHNGLKSVEQHLQTDRYARLRIGVGDRKEGDLADHVLGRFSIEEEKLLPDVLDRSLQALEIWLEKGITSAMDFANRKPSTPSIGEL
jgi:PTH1 family peptidyl-tRNA hydrolase